MIEKLEHSQLHKITLHNDAVHWYKKMKEIVVNSTLFDVHSFTVEKDSTHFWGLFDNEETALKNQVGKLLKETDQNNSSRNLDITKLMLQLWLGNIDKKVHGPSVLLLSGLNPMMATAEILSPDISIPSPPPRSQFTYEVYEDSLNIRAA